MPRHTQLPQGQYTVGCLDLMSGKDRNGILLKLYYPTDLPPIQEQDTSKWTKWFLDRKYMEGILKRHSLFIGNISSYLGEWITGNVLIPAIWEAPIAKGKFRTIVFSHGLTGHRNIYSSVLTDLASHGFIVAAVEHRDESASATFTLSNSDEKEWILLNTEFNKKKEVEYRNKQVKIRAAECIKTLDLLYQLNNGETVSNALKSSFLLKTLQNSFDFSKTVLIGHSFGGGTVMQTLALDKRFHLGVALDPWMFPIKDELENLASSIEQPILFILMENFQNGQNLDAMKKFMNRRNKFITVKESAHFNQTDAIFITNIEFLLWILDGSSGIDRKLALKINNHLVLDFLHKNIEDVKYSCRPIEEFLQKESNHFVNEAKGRAIKMLGWSSLSE